MSVSNDRGVRIVIGLAATAGAAVLLYFSASPELTCTRAASGVECEVAGKMLNIYPVGTARVSGVRSVVLVSGSIGTSSRAKAFLYFRTGSGDVDLGYFSQRFATNVGELDTFVRESAEPAMRIATGVTFRNTTAYAAIVFLLLGGLAMLASSSGRRRGRSVYDNPVT